MLLDFPTRLRAFAEVIVRTGLNLQPGQRLLVAEPYELQGVARSAEIIVEAVKEAALRSGGTVQGMIEILWSETGRMREFAAKKDWRGLARLAATNAYKINEYVQRKDAVLFLLGSQPSLMSGIPPEQIAEARRINGEYFAPVAQQLAQGATNWTAVPAPSSDWADIVYPELVVRQRLSALWETVFEAVRIPAESPQDGLAVEIDALVAWENHLRVLQKRRDELNGKRFKSLSYQGDGTDLTVNLPVEHVWCTAHLRTKSGIPFVANLPTEEVFTLPHKDSAEGVVRIARPVTFGGAVIEGIELEFQKGCVVRARAQTGETLLKCLLDTDPGANRLGEVAIVGGHLSPDDSGAANFSPLWTKTRLFHHVLLDENARSHVALGEGYGFCLKSPNPDALNRSLIHVDLPIAATANLRT